MIERERKFLVADSAIIESALAAQVIVQGYPIVAAHHELRVRCVDDGTAATLAVKSRAPGRERLELEWELPIAVAIDLLATTERQVRKTRFSVVDGGVTWSIDRFEGKHEGLVIAEAELTAADDLPRVPGWCGREVTEDRRYYNESLATSGIPPTV